MGGFCELAETFLPNVSPSLSLILLKRNQERHNCPNRPSYTPEPLLSERNCSPPQEIPVNATDEEGESLIAPTIRQYT